MSVRMAKEKPIRAEAPVVHKEVKPQFFPRLLFLFSIALIIIAVVNYLQFYTLPMKVLEGLLLVAGIWMFMLALEKGWYERRKHILKRYI